MNFRDLFSEGDHRFQMGLRRGVPGEFFGPVHPELTAERRHWLREKPGLYATLMPEGMPLLEECRTLAAEWGALPAEDPPGGEPDAAAATPEGRCARLGGLWEPDFLLVRADGEFTLLGGCVCFPSSWSPAEKTGLSLASIHSAVPGLNQSLGPGIRTLLARLTPGSAWFRHNWGLSRSPELNQHPSRSLPRLDAAVPLEEVWLRVEHQALVPLPQSGGILFGIRIAMHPLAEVRRDPEAAARLARALRTMPEDVAVYKGLAASRGRLETLLSPSFRE